MLNTVSAKGEPTSQAFSTDANALFHRLGFRQNSISCSEGVNKRTAHSLSPPAHPAANFGVTESDKEPDLSLPFEGRAQAAHFSCRATKKCCISRVLALALLLQVVTAAQQSEHVVDVLLVSISVEILFV